MGVGEVCDEGNEAFCIIDKAQLPSLPTSL